jgi:hypothetical protein
LPSANPLAENFDCVLLVARIEDIVGRVRQACSNLPAVAFILHLVQRCGPDVTYILKRYPTNQTNITSDATFLWVRHLLNGNDARECRLRYDWSPNLRVIDLLPSDKSAAIDPKQINQRFR